MPAAADEVVNPALAVPTRKSKPKAAAEAVKQTAQVALMKRTPKKLATTTQAIRTAQAAPMKKKPKNPRKKPEKVVEVDPVCAVRTT